MMKTSTKLFATGAASLLGVALVAGGAHAATAALSSADSPGQVLQVSGIAPASTQANATASAHANTNAKGLFGSPAAPARAKAKGASTSSPAPAMHSVAQVARPAAQTLPAYHAVAPRVSTPMQSTAAQPMPRTGMTSSIPMR
ncbi:MAG: hypothetical protein ACYDDU_20885 [Dermatophilaceae bacterium]